MERIFARLSEFGLSIDDYSLVQEESASGEKMPTRYELLAKDWGARLSRKGPTPSFDLIKARLADQLGGSPDDHLQLALGLVTLYHGASMLLLGEGIDPQTATAIKEACLAAIDSLVASAAKSKFPNRAVG